MLNKQGVKVKRTRCDLKGKKPVYNWRFGAMAAVTPQKMQYEFGSYYPAESSVEAATASSRWDVKCKRGEWHQKTESI